MSNSEIVLPFEIGFDELMLKVLHLIPGRGFKPPLLFVEILDGEESESQLEGQVLYALRTMLMVQARSGSIAHPQGWSLTNPNAPTHRVERIEQRPEGVFIIIRAECGTVRRLDV